MHIWSGTGAIILEKKNGIQVFSWGTRKPRKRKEKKNKKQVLNISMVCFISSKVRVLHCIHESKMPWTAWFCWRPFTIQDSSCTNVQHNLECAFLIILIVVTCTTYSNLWLASINENCTLEKTFFRYYLSCTMYKHDLLTLFKYI